VRSTRKPVTNCPAWTACRCYGTMIADTCNNLRFMPVEAESVQSEVRRRMRRRSNKRETRLVQCRVRCSEQPLRSTILDRSRETPVTSEAMNGPGNGAAPLTGARIPGSMFRSPFRTSECPTVRSGLVQPAIRRRLSRASCLLTLVFDPLC